VKVLGFTVHPALAAMVIAVSRSLSASAGYWLLALNQTSAQNPQIGAYVSNQAARIPCDQRA
jgi:hypothetical protein